MVIMNQQLKMNNTHNIQADRMRPIRGIKVRETAAEYVIALNVPGLRRDGFRVNLKAGDHVLTLEGERFARGSYEAFRHDFRLNNGVRRGAIRSEYDNGIWIIHVQKLCGLFAWLLSSVRRGKPSIAYPR